MIKFPFSRFEVCDRSMEPSFLSGNHVLTYNFSEIKPGSVIVFKYKNKYLIKRVKELKAGSIIAFSDNKKLARSVYKINKSDLIGRVFLKY